MKEMPPALRSIEYGQSILLRRRLRIARYVITAGLMNRTLSSASLSLLLLRGESCCRMEILTLSPFSSIS